MLEKNSRVRGAGHIYINSTLNCCICEGKYKCGKCWETDVVCLTVVAQELNNSPFYDSLNHSSITFSEAPLPLNLSFSVDINLKVYMKVT